MQTRDRGHRGTLGARGTLVIAIAAAILVGTLAACQSAAPASQDPVAHGKQLSADLGCTSCHSSTGGASVGPTWKGLYGKQVTLSDGATVTADDAYLKDRLTDPDAQTVTGYSSGVMRSVVRSNSGELGQAQNVDAIIAYIKSLK